MAKFTLDMAHIRRVEHSMMVSLEHVITVPVLEDGKNAGAVLYVGVSPFTVRGQDALKVSRLMDVAGRLRLANENEDERPQHPFTVFGVWESTGETLTEHVFAADPHEAMAIVAGCRDNPADLTILGAVDGKVSMTAACEDSGKSACAVDLVQS